MAAAKIVEAGALAIPNAVGKAGQAIVKPVIGRKRVLVYETVIERDGELVEAQVIEEQSRQVGALGLAVGAIAALIGLGIAAGAFASTESPEFNKLSPLQKVKARAAVERLKRGQSLFGFGFVKNPFHTATPQDQADFRAAVAAEQGISEEELRQRVIDDARAQGKTDSQINFILALLGYPPL